MKRGWTEYENYGENGLIYATLAIVENFYVINFWKTFYDLDF
jgi:hypothetical protein